MRTSVSKITVPASAQRRHDFAHRPLVLLAHAKESRVGDLVRVLGRRGNDRALKLAVVQDRDGLAPFKCLKDLLGSVTKIDDGSIHGPPDYVYAIIHISEPHETRHDLVCRL